MVWYVVPFWIITAYVTLPRIHRILTTIYVPDYFIGRSRTDDGLLGDPINVALLGSQSQVESAMENAGFTRADEISLRSSWKIITSTLRRKSYPEAPVSTLRLFGRQQDFAYQMEMENSPAKRHHIRFWRCPEGWMLPGGHKADWLAAGTFDKSVGLSLFTLQITHKIDPKVDEERDFVVGVLQRKNFGISVNVIEDFSSGYHSRNGGGDAIETDGDLPIVDLRQTIPSHEDAEILSSLKDPTSLNLSDKLRNPLVQASVQGTDVVVPTMARPPATIFGAVFSLLSAVVSIVLAIATANNPKLYGFTGIADSKMATDFVDSIEFFTVTMIIINVALALAQLVLALFVWVGMNWARITLMSVTSASIVTVFISAVRGEAHLQFSLDVSGTNLVTVALEILVVLALSSTNAQAYARNRRA